MRLVSAAAPMDVGAASDAIAEAVVHHVRDVDLSPPFRNPAEWSEPWSASSPPRASAVPSWRLLYVAQTDVMAAKCVQRAWRCFAARCEIARRRDARDRCNEGIYAAANAADAAASFSFWNGPLVGVLALLVIAFVVMLRPSALSALPPSSSDAAVASRHAAQQPAWARSPTPAAQQSQAQCADEERDATEAAARSRRAGQSALPNAADTQRAGTTTAREKRHRNEIPSSRRAEQIATPKMNMGRR